MMRERAESGFYKNGGYRSVWYMWLKTENCYLKILVEISAVKKYVEIYEILFKN